MRYIKKRQQYESGRDRQDGHPTFTYNPRTKHGISYGWWDISRVIGGTLVINTYIFSNTTAKHISKAWKLLGYPQDAVTISVRPHDGSLTSSADILSELDYDIKVLHEAARAPKTRKAKNIERLEQASKLLQTRELMAHLYELEALGVTKTEAATLDALAKGK